MNCFGEGEEPIVVARGGFSGVFPESSALANEVAVSNGLPNTVLYCNLQLTKDGLAICLSDILLENSTNIEQVFPKSRKTYEINGKVYKGWFSVDFMSDILFTKVACKFVHSIQFNSNKTKQNKTKQS